MFPNNQQVFLAKGYATKLNRYKLCDIVRLSERNPAKLTRGLLREIIGEDKLGTMNASTMPKDIFNAVESKTHSIYEIFKKNIMRYGKLIYLVLIFRNSLKVQVFKFII